MPPGKPNMKNGGPWIVFNPKSNLPPRRHYSDHASAAALADSMAQRTGEPFMVMKFHSGYHYPKDGGTVVETTPFDPLLPCQNCRMHFDKHEPATKKCLFGPSVWSPIPIEAATTDDIKSARDFLSAQVRAIKDKQAALDRDLDALEALDRDLRKKCRHLDAQGNSTWKGNFMYSGCEICGENDL